MPSCIVKGCNFSWKKKDPNIILHSFPSDLNTIKSWLLATMQATKQEFENIDELCQKILMGKPKGLYRMCSQHFTMDCYYQRGMLISLKREALPTIFTSKDTIKLKTLRPKIFKPRKDDGPLPDPMLVDMSSGGVPSSVVMGLPLRVIKLKQDYPVPLPNPCLISEQGYYIHHNVIYAHTQHRSADQYDGNREVLPPRKRTRTLGTDTEYLPDQRHKTTFTNKTVGVRHKEVQTEKSNDDQQPCRCKHDEDWRLASCLHPGMKNVSSAVVSQSKIHQMATQSLPTMGRSLELPQRSGVGLLTNVNGFPESPRSRKPTEPGTSQGVRCSYPWPAIKEEKPFGTPVSCDPDTELKSRQCNDKVAIKQEYEAKEEQSGGLDIKAEDTDLARVEIPGTSSSSDPSSENKYVVFDSCLNKLLMYCRCLADDGCMGRIVKFKKYFVGSSVSVKAECSNGHRFHMWDSQP
ncbi:uncharacterized protein [Pyxicephalus adspersus]|uniref:uncharacterized protein n=1 Tax=Pyxicephalus adspersus TaxID=30357 RepID=UPI003B5A86F9